MMPEGGHIVFSSANGSRIKRIGIISVENESLSVGRFEIWINILFTTLTAMGLKHLERKRKTKPKL